jgi:hypothetical protein
METSHSWVAIDAQRARHMAEDKLARIKGWREREEREHVEALVEKDKKSLFVRWGWRKPITYDEALKNDLDDGNGWISHVWAIRNMYYSRSEEVCERVLLGTRHGDPINITLEDLERLT